MTEKPERPSNTEEPRTALTDVYKGMLRGSREALSRVDVKDIAGNRAVVSGWLRRVLASRNRISTQIYLAFAVAVSLTIAASLVGWSSFNSVGEVQSRVNEGSVPDMAAAFGMAQRANTLVDAAPRLTTTDNPDEFNLASEGVGAANVALVNQLALLQGLNATDERYSRMRADVDSITANIHTIQSGMVESFPRGTRLSSLQTEISELGRQIDRALLEAVDDQIFYTITGYQELDEPPEARSLHFTTEEFTKYHLLEELQGNASLAAQLLQSAFGFSDPTSIGPLRQRLDAARARIARELDDVNASGDKGAKVVERVDPLLTNLFELGDGEQGALGLLEQQLTVAEQQRDLLAQNRSIAVNLLEEVDAFVGITNANVEDATLESSQAVLTGKVLLAALSAISVGGALLIATLFIGRVLLRRLDHLSVRMRGMAGGDLETEVEMSGRDEIADMAAALEVFRQHALEVQRLNLVEKLAQELEVKNEELESVLTDLRLAQDQIVAREKLAALGELTAGVAHEIRNPLNFVKNFAEVSDELLEEMTEIMDEGEDGALDDEQRGLIKEITEDLSSNLERIRSHGNRADRIVHDMLMMGRGSGDHLLTDLNSIVDEHARLAYHSARATDPDFQLNMLQDLDPDMGEISIVPQDLGRVFLNMVSNAGYATDQKRRELVESPNGDRSYMPTLWISTRRGDEYAEIRIRDNGMGIPSEVVDKIFNPFFTTKPTNMGTGLGLAMCSDIVREHGGTISVDTQPGEYTEMTVQIPLEPPAVQLEEAV